MIEAFLVGLLLGIIAMAVIVTWPQEDKMHWD